MNHLDFVLWMLLFPVMESISTYIDIKRKQLQGEKDLKYGDGFGYTAFLLLLYFIVGCLLF